MVVALLAGVLLSEKLSGLLYEVLGPLILLIIPLMVALPVGYTVVVTMAASALPRVQCIDESSITLKGVSDKFRRAVMEAEGA
jgi:ABC-type phosphate transport system permease subunit